MARREPISDTTRDAVMAAINAGGSCRGIAREHKVSPGYVSKLAKAMGASDAFDRTRTEPASQARKFDAKAARAAAVEALYGDFERFRQRIWSPYTQLGSGPGGTELITTLLPSLRDQQSGIVAAAVCLDKALILERHDDTQGAEAGNTMINELFGALGMAYHRIVEREDVVDGATGERVTAAEADAAKARQVRAAEDASTGRTTGG